MAWLKYVVNVIFCEIPSLISATRKIDSKIEKIKQQGLDPNDNRTDLPLDLIQEHARFDLERLRIIEDKAKVTTMGITIALALFVAGAGRLTPSVSETTIQIIEYLLDGLTVTAVLFFLVAGYYALKAIRVKPVFRVSLEDELLFKSEDEKRTRNLEMLELNRKVISKYTNFVEVSYNAVRNGIVSVATLIIIFTVSNHLSFTPHQIEERMSHYGVGTYNNQQNIIIIESDRKIPCNRDSIAK